MPPPVEYPASYNPFAPPAPASPPPGRHGTAFTPAPAAYPRDEPVPPPPIAPEGPGQVPYGYPGGPGGYGYGSPGGPAYGWPGLRPPPSNGTGMAGLVLGILAAIAFWLWPLAVLLGGPAVVLGTVGRQKASRGESTNAGQALAGIVCGAAGIVLGLVRAAYLIAT